MSKFRCSFLLGTITLFLLAGAAWGQSRTPTSSGPEKPAQSDKGDVKPSPDGQRELPIQDLREQPVQAQEGRAGKSLKKQSPVKPKSRVSRDKKPGAGKPASGAHKDWFTQETKSGWWPQTPNPASPDSSSLELSLQRDREKNSTPDEYDALDDSEAKEEEFETMPRELKKLFLSPKSPHNRELKED